MGNKKRILSILIALLLFAGQAVAAEEQTVEMNFKDADIETVVKFISKLTGKNFILDDKSAGRGKVTVISPTPLTKDEAYEVFQAILGVKELTLVPAGKILKIISQQEAKQTNIETLSGPGKPGDRYVTRLVPLSNVDVSTVAKILDPLRSKHSSIVAYEPTNTLIITDAYSNIERLLGIIKAIDIEAVGPEMRIFQVKFASADTIAGILRQSVVESGGRTTPRRQPAKARGAASRPATASVQGGAQVTTKIIADERTNSLIVIADLDTLGEVEKLLATLDVEIPSGTGRINVYSLKYADAENVANVLSAIYKSASPKDKGRKPKIPGQPGAANTPAQLQSRAGGVSVSFDEPVSITADKATNSLVIVAVQQDYQTLKAVIEQLDIRRPQVLIEAAIMEMSYYRTRELGVEWRSTTDANSSGKNVFGGTNFGGFSNLSNMIVTDTSGDTATSYINPYATPSGLFLGAVDGSIELGGLSFPNIGALVNALQTRSDVEILSTPHLLTTDNEEAEIIVSDNIPFQTSEKFDSNGNPIFTYEYRDVGLKLTFTPQINDDGYIKLKLFQEISDVVSIATGTNENAPSTTKRSAKTTVVVKDGATVVIGGLIQNDRNITRNEVPCLGDIPILGMFFGSDGNEVDKKNLMMFLTPHIIRNSSDLEKLTAEKRREYDEFAEEMKKKASQDYEDDWDEFEDEETPADEADAADGE